MSLINSKINSVEAEVLEVASRVTGIQLTAAGGNTVVKVIGDNSNSGLGFKLLDALGNLRGSLGMIPTASCSTVIMSLRYMGHRGSVRMATTDRKDIN